jgi:hypothetical protein
MLLQIIQQQNAEQDRDKVDKASPMKREMQHLNMTHGRTLSNIEILTYQIDLSILYRNKKMQK